MGNDEEGPLPRCANCDIEIEWGPTIVGGEHYCCIGCVRGGPCSCDYSDLPREPITVQESQPTRRGSEATERFRRR